MKKTTLDLPGVVMALCAVTAVGWMFSPGRRSGPATVTMPAVSEIQIDTRAAAIASGLTLHGDPATAELVVTEFVDYECPVCASAAPGVEELIESFGDRVAVVVQHYPLTIHAQAVPAAVAAECADRQGVFPAFHRAAFAEHHLVRGARWEDLGERAGVGDATAFALCLSEPAEAFPRIEAGMGLGDRNGVTGTPTFWYGRWHVDDRGRWRQAVEDALAGRRPLE